MTYHRMWFHKDLFAVTLGGGQMNGPGRYLTLPPPIHGALRRAPRSDPPGGNNLYPQFYTCQSGVTAGTADLNAATVVCGASGGVWFPDLRRSEAKIYTGILVKF
jgi:hypothetical protein